MRKQYSQSSRTASAVADDDYGELPLTEDVPAERSRRARRQPGSVSSARRDNGRNTLDRNSRFDDFDERSLAFDDPDGYEAPARGNAGRGRRPQKPTTWQWLGGTTAGRWTLAACSVFLLAALGMGAFLVREFLRTDLRFRVASSDQVQVEGNHQVTGDDIRAVFGEDIGRNLFFIPIAERRKQAEALPWVEHASVERLLPNHIRVRVTERVPVAFAQNGDRVMLIDHAGTLLETPTGAGAPKYSFPVLSGVADDLPASTRGARMGEYLHFVKEMDAHGENISSRLSEVDLSDPEDIQAVIEEGSGTITLHLGDEKFYERYQTYRTHLAEWQQQYPRLNKVDLQNAPQVVLGVGEAPAAPAAATPVVTAEKAAPAAVAPKPVAAAAVVPVAAHNAPAVNNVPQQAAVRKAAPKPAKKLVAAPKKTPPHSAARPVALVKSTAPVSTRTAAQTSAMRVFNAQSPQPAAQPPAQVPAQVPAQIPVARSASAPVFAPVHPVAAKPALHLHAGAAGSTAASGGQQ